MDWARRSGVTSADMDEFGSTRRTLHGIAELLIAGPQYREHGTIRLKVTDGGISGVKLPVFVGPESLSSDRGPIAYTGTFSELAFRAGVAPGPPTGLYHDTSGVELDEVVAIDKAAAETILGWFATGHQALVTFAPDSEPVLWPEHFDLGITIDEVNYGVSPGDSGIGEPYAYIGPWKPRQGEFWNKSFGAARTMTELPTADAIAEFFAQGQRLSRESS
jgi:hypothetical protein